MLPTSFRVYTAFRAVLYREGFTILRQIIPSYIYVYQGAILEQKKEKFWAAKKNDCQETNLFQLGHVERNE